MYFLTVARLIPNSRAIPRIDMPLRFAFCIAFHRAFWRNVAFRGGMAAILPAAVSWLATGSGAVSSAQLVSSWRRVVAQVSIFTDFDHLNREMITVFDDDFHGH